MAQQQKKTEGTKKKQRPHHFAEPKKRKAKVIARLHSCPACKHKVRVNSEKRIAWHRSGAYHQKWCIRSATKLLSIIESK